MLAITVNDPGDFTDADPNVTTLREAILIANQLSNPDIIDFSTNIADALDGGTILLQLGELDITEAVTIDATMLPNGITIDANDADGIKNGNGRSLKV